MNDIIRLLQNHRSIRKFKDIPLTREQLETIAASAQMASSSSNVQAYTIIAVTDSAVKEELARLSGDQAYVANNGAFLVFCGDLHRLQEATVRNGETFHQNTESFIVATVDAALAAQNAAVAAESLGLGICFIGGVRNNAEAVSKLLSLPPLVYPVFGLCVGVPDHESTLRPRMPQSGILHLNAYQTGAVSEAIDAYDPQMYEYYKQRTGGRKLTTWSRDIADKYRKPVRAHMKPFLEARGFLLV